MESQNFASNPKKIGLKSSENMTQVSIILATYNRAHFIEGTLKSISDQSFKNWECLIIDDGSKDNTEVVVKSFVNQDKRFKYFKRGIEYKKGLPGSRNQGLELARGDYVIFFDDDDIIHPGNLQFCLNELRRNNVYFCRYDKKPFTGKKFTLTFATSENYTSRYFKLSDIDKMITGEIPFASCCVMWDKKCFERNRFNEELMYAEEWECYSRILSSGYEGVSIDRVLYFNRKHPNSNTGEFQNYDPVRRSSKVEAAKLIINNLSTKNLFKKPDLEKFFLRMGFDLQNLSLILLTLKRNDSGFIRTWKYKLGFRFYPLLKPLLKFKGRIFQSF